VSVPAAHLGVQSELLILSATSLLAGASDLVNFCDVLVLCSSMHGRLLQVKYMISICESSSCHMQCVLCGHIHMIILGLHAYSILQSFQSSMLHNLLPQVVSEVMSRDLKMEVDDELMQAAKH